VKYRWLIALAIDLIRWLIYTAEERERQSEEKADG